MPKCPNCGFEWDLLPAEALDTTIHPNDPNKLKCTIVTLEQLQNKNYRATLHKDAFEAEGVFSMDVDPTSLTLPKEVLLLNSKLFGGAVHDAFREVIDQVGEFWFVTEPDKQMDCILGILYHFKLIGRLDDY